MTKESNKEFRYMLPELKNDEYPNIPKPDNRSLSCYPDSEGNIHIQGDSEGLLYLAKYIAAMGLHENKTGLHIHLDPEYDMLDKGSRELTILNVEFFPDHE